MNFLKKELIATISKMTDANLQETKEKVNKLFEFAELSKSIWDGIPDFKIHNNEPITEDISTINTKHEGVLTTNANSHYFALKENELLLNSNTIPLPTTHTSPKIALKSYPLQRKLKGGILTLEKGECFVPEKEIRRNGFVHGDFLQVEGSGKNLVFTKVKDSQTEHESDRGEIDYCVLTNSPEGFIVASQQFINGDTKPIKLDGENPYQFLISDVDVTQFGLKDGSVVSIAYSKANPVSKRVVWQYDEAEIKNSQKKIS